MPTPKHRPVDTVAKARQALAEAYSLMADETKNIEQARLLESLKIASGNRNGEPPGIKQWISNLINPQTILWIAILIGGIFGAWLTITTRITVLEASTTVQSLQLQKQLDKLEAEIKEHQRIEDVSESQSMDRLQRSMDTDTQRLWADITELRKQISQNTLLIGQTMGKSR